MTTRSFSPVLFLTITALAAAGAAAQSEPTVKATGTATITRPADHVRLEVQVQSRGKDLKEAFSKLAEFEANVMKRIAAVQEGTVEFDPPQMNSEDDPQQAYARMMANMGNPGAHKKPATNPGVTVNATLHASWQIKETKADEVAKAAYDLVEKLKSAAPWKAPAAGGNDLKGQQDEEQAEENAAAMANNPFAAAMPKPGQPSFSYTATLTPEETSRGTADAFKAAKTRADDLAKAAGKTLGDILRLDQQTLGGAGAGGNPMADYIAALQGQGAPKQTPVSSDLVTGDKPGIVTAQR
jgi:hypothetical protein